MPTIFTHAMAGACLARVLAPVSQRRVLTGLAAVKSKRANAGERVAS